MIVVWLFSYFFSLIVSSFGCIIWRWVATSGEVHFLLDSFSRYCPEIEQYSLLPEPIWASENQWEAKSATPPLHLLVEIFSDFSTIPNRCLYFFMYPLLILTSDITSPQAPKACSGSQVLASSTRQSFFCQDIKKQRAWWIERDLWRGRREEGSPNPPTTGN